MFCLSHCCQSPFPHLPRMPPTLCWFLDLLCCSSDSNLVLLLCVLASNVHSYHVHFLLWELSMSFYTSIDTESA